MAIELYSDTSGVIVSPRISFSHNFCQSEAIPVEQRLFRSKSRGFNSSVDFDFCVHESFDEQSSSADELFSDGKILAVKMKRKTTESDHPRRMDQSLTDPPRHMDQSLTDPPVLQSQSVTKRAIKVDTRKESKSSNNEAEEKPNSKPFWSFRRSSSCGSGYGRSFCPLPLLSRSYSTGSTSNSNRRSPLPKEGHNLKYSIFRNAAPKSSHCSSSAVATSYQKPPLKKNHYSYATGTNATHILNIHTGTLFGLTSVFSISKDKTKKK